MKMTVGKWQQVWIFILCMLHGKALTTEAKAQNATLHNVFLNPETHIRSFRLEELAKKQLTQGQSLHLHTQQQSLPSRPIQETATSPALHLL